MIEKKKTGLNMNGNALTPREKRIAARAWEWKKNRGIPSGYFPWTGTMR